MDNSELKPCPFCGGERAAAWCRDEKPIMSCMDCGADYANRDSCPSCSAELLQLRKENNSIRDKYSEFKCLSLSLLKNYNLLRDCLSYSIDCGEHILSISTDIDVFNYLADADQSASSLLTFTKQE
jgi:hypothetical protein